MVALQYWMMTRPHRKLIRVPKTIAAFAAVAAGKRWQGNRELQIAFETELEKNDLKARGDHTERDRGRGGSGGRTHAALLSSLGLFFTYKNAANSSEEVYLTLAGQALVDQEDALPILRRQIMAHQFPSPYSLNSRVDERFRLRPFVLLLRLLRDPDLDGHLSDPEIAATVLPYAESHTPKEAEQIKKRVLAFRDRGLRSLDENFASKLGLSEAYPLRDHIYKSDKTLGAIANTVVQWIRYTGYALAAPGDAYGRDEKTVTAVNPNMLDEIDEAIGEWGRTSVDPLTHLRSETDSFKRLRAEAAFQRTYGRTPTKSKDSRTIGELRQASEKAQLTGLVSAAIVHLFRTTPVREVTEDLVAAVHNHSGLPEDVVRAISKELIRSPQEGLSQFLDRYQQMAFSGTDEAIAFEEATAKVLVDIFGLKARHVGQNGRVPDVEVHSDEWLGIIDTKAYAAYDLPSDHQLRMQASYIPRYQGGNGDLPELRFFSYIAGGFAPSFNAKLSSIVGKTGIAGSGIGIVPWIQLIRGYETSSLSRDSLLDLWTMCREITSIDVAEALRT